MSNPECHHIHPRPATRGGLGGFDGTVLLVDVEQRSEAAWGQGHLDSVTHMAVLARTDHWS